MVLPSICWLHVDSHRQTSPIISLEDFWAKLTLVDFTEKVPWILENFWAGFTFTAARTDFFGGQLLDSAPLVLPGISVPDSFTSPNITDKAPLIRILEDFWAVFAFIVTRTDFFGLDSAPLVLPSRFVPDSFTLPNITGKAPLNLEDF